MVSNRPGRRQTFVIHLEPKRRTATLGYAFMTLLFLALAVVVLLRGEDLWPAAGDVDADVQTRAISITGAVMGFFALLCLGAAFVNGRRWRIGSRIERLSRDPSVAPLFPDRTESPTPPAPTIPPLEVRIIKARKLQKPRHLRRVTPESNVVGHRPLEIAFLRLFENQPRMRTFIQGAWREFGHVHLLRSAASVTPREYRWAKRSGGLAGLFATSQDRLAAELDRCRSQPHRKGWYRLKGVASSTIRVRDKYGGYPLCAILCHGTFWRTAVDSLLDRVDVVAFDLSGLTGENEGTLYELHRVIDRFPIEHVVFLADERTNRTFVTNVLQQAWANMAAGSPNAVTSPKTAAVVITDYVQRRTTQTTTGHGAAQTTTTQVQIKLVAKRRQTRRVVKMAQDRIDGLIQ